MGEQGGEALVEVVMGEGRKREVRRLLAAVGHPVQALVRTAIGPVHDPALRPGTWRHADPRRGPLPLHGMMRR